MRDETKQTLGLFIEKSQKLLDGSFTRFVQENGLNFTISFTQDEGMKTSSTAPDEEAVDAFILTLRMFIQERDAISFDKMAEVVKDPDVSQEWKDHFLASRDHLSQRLDSPPNAGGVVNGKTYTRKEITETFIYGHYAHVTPARLNQYVEWKQAGPLVFTLFKAAFMNTLLDILHEIAFMKAISEAELDGDLASRLAGNAANAQLAPATA